VDELLDGIKADAVEAGMICTSTIPDEARKFLKSKKIEAQAVARFEELDVNGDGKLQQTELAWLIAELTEAQYYEVTEAHCMKFVQIFDQDDDGLIDVEEFKAFFRFCIVAQYIDTQGASAEFHSDARVDS